MAKQTDNKLQVSFSSPSSLDDVGMVLRKGSKEISLTESELSLITEIYSALLNSGEDAQDEAELEELEDEIDRLKSLIYSPTAPEIVTMGDDGEDIPEATETESAST